MKKQNILVVVLSLLMIGGVAYAAFSDTVEVLGTSVSVGSADIKLLSDLGGGVEGSNLVDSMQGPTFEMISPYWSEDYSLKVFNNGTSELQLTSFATYETANDPEDLRQIIYVEPFGWDDVNGDGIVDATEIGASFGRNTIVKWKTHGYTLETVPSGGLKGYVLRFSTESIPDSKQGAVGTFGFEIDATEM